MELDFKIARSETEILTIDAMAGGEMAGNLTGVIDADVFRIRSLVVATAYRGEKISYDLLARLQAYLMVHTDAELIEASFGYLEQAVMDQYNYIFASMDYIFDLQELSLEFSAADLTDVMKNAALPSDVYAFEDMPGEYTHKIANRLKKMGFISQQEHFLKNTDSMLSCAIVSDAAPTAFLWVTQVRDGLHRIAAIFGNGSTNALIRLVKFAAVKSSKRFGAETRFILEAYNDSTYNLVMKLTENRAKPSALVSRFVRVV